MQLCGNLHTEVCFADDTPCPVCSVLKELDIAQAVREEENSRLRAELNSAQCAKEDAEFRMGL